MTEIPGLIPVAAGLRTGIILCHLCAFKSFWGEKNKDAICRRRFSEEKRRKTVTLAPDFEQTKRGCDRQASV